MILPFLGPTYVRLSLPVFNSELSSELKIGCVATFMDYPKIGIYHNNKEFIPVTDFKLSRWKDPTRTNNYTIHL